jgi:crossover junction endodeoxyribonuclease RuvC
MTIELAVGIDPGLTGGFAFLNYKHELLMLYKMPVIETRKQKKQAKTGKVISSVTKDVNAAEVADILRPLTDMGQVHVFIEKVHTMPKQGIASAGKFMLGFGVVLGCIAALRLPSTELTPQAWMKQIGMRKGKDGARARATALFPAWGPDFSPSNADGLADATLIALAGLYSLQKAVR